jgi:diguanylate cyclase (GGDEF)-like protein
MFGVRWRTIWRAVIAPTLLALALLGLLVGGVLSLSTDGSDEAAIRRQTHLLELAVRQGIADVRKDQEASTNWDDAVVRVRQRPLDMEWLDTNLGVWFNTYYGHDETYVLDGDDRAVYAMEAGKRADPRAFSAVSAHALPLVAQLRGLLREEYVPPESSGELTAGVVDIAVVRGRPAILSLKPIVSETGNIAQAPGSHSVHISLRYLDGSFLADISRSFEIEGAAFAWEKTGATSIPIRSRNRATVGYVNWRPFRPGEAVAKRMIPVLLLALALIGIGLSLLLHRNLRSRLALEASRAQAQHLAFHDPLTSLPNRALFDDRLNQALAATRRQGSAAVALMDLDRFKHVNDTLGHLAGDALIREFGKRLGALVREMDTIARIGGDEFALLLPGSPSKADVERLCERILTAVREPFNVLGSEARVGVSVGVVFVPEDGSERTDVLRKADIALYRAKEEGRDRFVLFEPHMDETVRLRATIEEDLRRALASGTELAVHYQPQMSASGLEIVGVEALVRWEHPTRGPIAPDQFIPIAESTGLICDLGDWVMRQACVAAHRWPALMVAVNVSPVQFRSRDFLDRQLAIVEEAGITPDRIQLEVTEGVLLDSDAIVGDALQKLRAAGFTIALDDFGTGYSSLSYLGKFDVDKIKIDRSFIRALGETVDSTAIVTAVLALGKGLGLSVTAEGVETAGQRKFLEAAGCNEMQGFLFSPALPFAELEARLSAAPLSDAA